MQARATTGDFLHVGVLILGIVLIVIGAESGNEAALFLAVGITLLVLLTFSVVGMSKNADISLFLLVPTVMSVFQNVYLSPFALDIPEGALQVVIVVNALYAVLLYVALTALKPAVLPAATRKAARTATWVLLVLLVYGLGMMVLSGNDIAAGIASARNLLSPMLFFLVGLYGASFAAPRYYMRLLLALGVLALIMAAVEYTVPEFWPTLGLHHLWEKKGITVTPGSFLPKNFYASEQLVPGEFIRRMAGPFADPVNFGTFLFALSMVAWFLKARIIYVATLIAALLTVSKGAMLGVLTFVAVWTRKFRSTFEFLLALAVTLAAGLYFYAFTQSSSTGSTTAHINGLLAAFVELPAHPFGRGFGGTGVIAGLFADEAVEGGSAILESGFGMVIGQLGIFGMIGYVAFFAMIIRALAKIADPRVYVLGMGLTLAFILNAAFNEVALSPNSSAVYFIILGLIVGTSGVYERPRAAIDLMTAKRATAPATTNPSIS